MQWVGVNQLRTSSGNAIQAGDLIDEATGSLLVKPVNAVCVPVHNATGSPLTKGMLVYINGFYYNSNYPTIAAADNTDATKQAQFVVLSDIADGADGYVNGIAMVRFMDTSARTVGDIAYLSTAGGITFTAPTTAGTMQQPVGVVASKSSSGANGDVYFFPSISRETENGLGIDPLSITAGMIAAGAVTNAKLASTAVTESVTVPKTFTHASLSDTAGILGSQLSASAAIAGTQLASNAAIAGSQLSATAGITGSQLSASAAIAGTQLSASAAIAGTQLSSTAAIAGSQLGTGTVKQIKGTVTFNGGATQAIGTLPAGAILLQAIAVCTATFNGDTPTPSLTVGYTGGGNGAKIITSPTLTAAAVTGEAAGDLGADLYSTTKRVKFYAAQTVVNGYYTAATNGPTTGSIDVYLIYVQTAAGVV